MYGSVRGEGGGRHQVYGSYNAQHVAMIQPQPVPSSLLLPSYYHGNTGSLSPPLYQPSISIATSFSSYTSGGTYIRSSDSHKNPRTLTTTANKQAIVQKPHVVILQRPQNESAKNDATKTTSVDKLSMEDTDNAAESVENKKEKTPMCLVNELARYNKITHQYSLLDEQGPAHKKTFYVKLLLGTEEYKAEGQSIKKAQHAAATEALKMTTYCRPPPKPSTRNGRSTTHNGSTTDPSVTPTVELNSIAMKLGLKVVYTLTPSAPSLYSQPSMFSSSFGTLSAYGTAQFGGLQMGAGDMSLRPPGMRCIRGQGEGGRPARLPPGLSSTRTIDYPGTGYEPRNRYVRQSYSIVLRIGDNEYSGTGVSLQAARHSAAAEALKYLRTLPSPGSNILLKSSTSSSGDMSSSSGSAQHTLKDERDDESDEDEDEKSSAGEECQKMVKNVEEMRITNKSEISVVHEIALKRNIAVNFEVIKESGPSHLRTYVTRCTCGDLVTEGDANSKRLSKKKSAERMIEELRRLPALPASFVIPPATGKLKKSSNKPRQNKHLSKIQKASPDYGVGINPISRLAQIQQAKKGKEPAYKLLEERGLPRQREFVIVVTVDEHECQGVGPNKKLAKRYAAETMLQLLGYCKQLQPSKPAIKVLDGSVTIGSGSVSPGSTTGAGQISGGDKHVTFREPESIASSTTAVHANHRQPVPGVIMMPDSNSSKSPAYRRASTTECTNETTAAIINQLLNTGSSSIMEAMLNTEQHLAIGGGIRSPDSSSSFDTRNAVVRPKDQLLYLASVLGFQVQFTDFPTKGNNKQYLSIATLSTNPPQHSHGSAPTIDEANDNAALLALKNLAEVGLDGLGCGSLGPGGQIKTEFS